MRFYANFPEATNELRRELKEMGIQVRTKSVQNLNIEGKKEYETLELQNYIYTVIHPKLEDIPLRSLEWAEAELSERLYSYLNDRGGVNPGTAWKIRRETWGPLINGRGEFDYTYSQRYSDGNLYRIIDLLKKDRFTRRAFMPVFDMVEDMQNMLNTRIPCTLGYWFNYRNDKLNMTYLLRSSDFSEHFNYDIWLSTALLKFVAKEVGDLEVGTFTHWIGSFHVFSKDVEDVF